MTQPHFYIQDDTLCGFQVYTNILVRYSAFQIIFQDTQTGTVVDTLQFREIIQKLHLTKQFLAVVDSFGGLFIVYYKQFVRGRHVVHSFDLLASMQQNRLVSRPLRQPKTIELDLQAKAFFFTNVQVQGEDQLLISATIAQVDAAQNWRSAVCHIDILKNIFAFRYTRSRVTALNQSYIANFSYLGTESGEVCALFYADKQLKLLNLFCQYDAPVRAIYQISERSLVLFFRSGAALHFDMFQNLITKSVIVCDNPEGFCVPLPETQLSEVISSQTRHYENVGQIIPTLLSQIDFKQQEILQEQRLNQIRKMTDLGAQTSQNQGKGLEFATRGCEDVILLKDRFVVIFGHFLAVFDLFELQLLQLLDLRPLVAKQKRAKQGSVLALKLNNKQLFIQFGTQIFSYLSDFEITQFRANEQEIQGFKTFIGFQIQQLAEKPLKIALEPDDFIRKFTQKFQLELENVGEIKGAVEIFAAMDKLYDDLTEPVVIQSAATPERREEVLENSKKLTTSKINMTCFSEQLEFPASLLQESHYRIPEYDFQKMQSLSKRLPFPTQYDDESTLKKKQEKYEAQQSIEPEKLIHYVLPAADSQVLEHLVQENDGLEYFVQDWKNDSQKQRMKFVPKSMDVNFYTYRPISAFSGRKRESFVPNTKFRSTAQKIKEQQRYLFEQTYDQKYVTQNWLTLPFQANDFFMTSFDIGYKDEFLDSEHQKQENIVDNTKLTVEGNNNISQTSSNNFNSLIYTDHFMTDSQFKSAESATPFDQISKKLIESNQVTYRNVIDLNQMSLIMNQIEQFQEHEDQQNISTSRSQFFQKFQTLQGLLQGSLLDHMSEEQKAEYQEAMVSYIQQLSVNDNQKVSLQSYVDFVQKKQKTFPKLQAINVDFINLNTQIYRSEQNSLVGSKVTDKLSNAQANQLNDGYRNKQIALQQKQHLDTDFWTKDVQNQTVFPVKQKVNDKRLDTEQLISMNYSFESFSEGNTDYTMSNKAASVSQEQIKVNGEVVFQDQSGRLYQVVEQMFTAVDESGNIVQKIKKVKKVFKSTNPEPTLSNPIRTLSFDQQGLNEEMTKYGQQFDLHNNQQFIANDPQKEFSSEKLNKIYTVDCISKIVYLLSYQQQNIGSFDAQVVFNPHNHQFFLANLVSSANEDIDQVVILDQYLFKFGKKQIKVLAIDMIKLVFISSLNIQLFQNQLQTILKQNLNTQVTKDVLTACQLIKQNFLRIMFPEVKEQQVVAQNRVFVDNTSTFVDDQFTQKLQNYEKLKSQQFNDTNAANTVSKNDTLSEKLQKMQEKQLRRFVRKAKKQVQKENLKKQLLKKKEFKQIESDSFEIDIESYSCSSVDESQVPSTSVTYHSDDENEMSDERQMFLKQFTQEELELLKYVKFRDPFTIDPVIKKFKVFEKFPQCTQLLRSKSQQQLLSSDAQVQLDLFLQSQNQQLNTNDLIQSSPQIPDHSYYYHFQLDRDVNYQNDSYMQSVYPGYVSEQQIEFQFKVHRKNKYKVNNFELFVLDLESQRTSHRDFMTNHQTWMLKQHRINVQRSIFLDSNNKFTRKYIKCADQNQLLLKWYDSKLHLDQNKLQLKRCSSQIIKSSGYFVDVLCQNKEDIQYQQRRQILNAFKQQLNSVNVYDNILQFTLNSKDDLFAKRQQQIQTVVQFNYQNYKPKSRLEPDFMSLFSPNSCNVLDMNDFEQYQAFINTQSKQIRFKSHTKNICQSFSDDECYEIYTRPHKEYTQLQIQAESRDLWYRDCSAINPLQQNNIPPDIFNQTVQEKHLLQGQQINLATDQVDIIEDVINGDLGAAALNLCEEFYIGSKFDITCFDMQNCSSLLSACESFFTDQIVGFKKSYPQPILQNGQQLQNNQLYQLCNCEYDLVQREHKKLLQQLRYVKRQELKFQRQCNQVLTSSRQISRVVPDSDNQKLTFSKLFTQRQNSQKIQTEKVQIPVSLLELFLIKQSSFHIVQDYQFIFSDQTKTSSYLAPIQNMDQVIKPVLLDGIKFLYSCSSIDQSLRMYNQQIKNYIMFSIQEVRKDQGAKLLELVHEYQDEMIMTYHTINLTLDLGRRNKLAAILRTYDDHERKLREEKRQRVLEEQGKRAAELQQQLLLEQQEFEAKQRRQFEALDQIVKLMLNVLQHRTGYQYDALSLLTIRYDRHLNYHKYQFSQALNRAIDTHNIDQDKLMYELTLIELSIEVLRFQIGSDEDFLPHIPAQALTFMKESIFVFMNRFTCLLLAFEGQSDLGVAQFTRGFMNRQEIYQRNFIQSVHKAKRGDQESKKELVVQKIDLNEQFKMLSPIRKQFDKQKLRYIYDIQRQNDPKSVIAQSNSFNHASASKSLQQSLIQNDIQRANRIVESRQLKLQQQNIQGLVESESDENVGLNEIDQKQENSKQSQNENNQSDNQQELYNTASSCENIQRPSQRCKTVLSLTPVQRDMLLINRHMQNNTLQLPKSTLTLLDQINPSASKSRPASRATNRSVNQTAIRPLTGQLVSKLQIQQAPSHYDQELLAPDAQLDIQIVSRFAK